MIPSTVGMMVSKGKRSSLKHSSNKRNPKPSRLPKEYRLELRYVQAAMDLDLYVTKEFIYSLLGYFLLNILCCFVTNAVV